MITGINIPENKEKIAIVAVGYNRKKSLSRLLSSLEIAYYQHEDILDNYFDDYLSAYTDMMQDLGSIEENSDRWDYKDSYTN